MAARSPSWFAPLAVALAGCGSGCDGERGKPPETPRLSPGTGDAGAAAAVPDGGGPPTVSEPPAADARFLDAPAGALDGLFRAFDAAERRDPGGRALAVFFGDSHTAGDSMTSRLRVAWQARFGDGGRGLVAAGRPKARHYYQRDVRYGATGIWRSSIGGTKDPEPFGIAGLRVWGEKPGAQLWVETCSECQAGTSVGQFEILYQAAPDRGLLRYRVDEGKWQELSLKTTAIQPPHPARLVFTVPDGPHRLTLEHGGGGVVDLYGVVMERGKPGVIVDSLGVVGRRLVSLRSWDWSIIGEQLATRDPRLVVLQYGTNEADEIGLDLDAVARAYDDTIQRIRAAVPASSILILGPPDMGQRAGGAACDRMKPPRPGVDAAVPLECEWRTPGALREIIAVQHAAAVRNGVAFFDTFAAMGGADLMDSWFMTEPRLAFKDRIHLTDLGYQRWADELSKAVLATYGRWRRVTHQPPARPGAP